MNYGIQQDLNQIEKIVQVFLTKELKNNIFEKPLFSDKKQRATKLSYQTQQERSDRHKIGNYKSDIPFPSTALKDIEDFCSRMDLNQLEKLSKKLIFT